MFDGVLHCSCSVFTGFLVSLHDVNVSIQYNGGLLPDIILLTQWYSILCLMGYCIASVVAFLVSFSPTSYC